MSDNGSTWRNRIVGHGEEDPKRLVDNPRNWRIHPLAQQQGLEGVLDDVGWIDEIKVNKRTGFVLDGHLRVALALRRGEPTVPVKYVDISEEEEALVLATLDPLAAMAVTDREKLTGLLHVVETDNAQVAEMLAGLVEREGLENLENVEFPEYDESIADTVEWIECPECGHKWPK